MHNLFVAMDAWSDRFNWGLAGQTVVLGIVSAFVALYLYDRTGQFIKARRHRKHLRELLAEYERRAKQKTIRFSQEGDREFEGPFMLDVPREDVA